MRAAAAMAHEYLELERMFPEHPMAIYLETVMVIYNHLEASIDSFSYLLLGNQLRTWELHSLVSYSMGYTSTVKINYLSKLYPFQMILDLLVSSLAYGGTLSSSWSGCPDAWVWCLQYWDGSCGLAVTSRCASAIAISR